MARWGYDIGSGRGLRENVKTYWQRSRTRFSSAIGTGRVHGWNVGIVEAFFEFKNVIKSAPEVTFWGGQRFYDRYDIHPQDYFFLNTSGVGGGAYNIDLGIGSLAIAYFGGIRSGTGAFTFGGNDATDDFNQFNLQVNGGQGSFYRHTLDIRLGDIDVFSGKLKLVLLGAYQQGGRFTTGRGGEGHVPNSGGVGGGAIYQYDLPARFGKKSFIQIAALYGWGLIDFDRSSVELNKLGRGLWLPCPRITHTILRSLNQTTRSARLRTSTPTTTASAHGQTSSGYGIQQITFLWGPGQPINSTIRASPATRSTATGPFPAHPPICISLLLELGLFIGYGVPSRFKVPSVTAISRTIEEQGPLSAMEAP